MDASSPPPVRGVHPHPSRDLPGPNGLLPPPLDKTARDPVAGPAPEHTKSLHALDFNDLSSLLRPLSVADPVAVAQPKSEKPAPARNERRRWAKCSASTPNSPEPEFLVLIPDERLFFRVVTAIDKQGAVRKDADAQVATAIQRFRDAFAAVWSRIPAPDRICMRKYWCSTLRWLSYAQRHTESSWPTPLIQLVPALDQQAGQQACDECGLALNFPLYLCCESPEYVVDEITNVLALVLRYANGAHWTLYLKAVEEPMERWEAEVGAAATEAASDRKFARLEEAYLKKYEAEMAAIRRSWGFGEQASTRS